MQVKQAMDEFLFYMEVERNVSPNTMRSYAYDLHVFETFLARVHGTSTLEQIRNSTVRRFVQDQVIEHQTHPRTLQRRISCLKSFSRFCAKENWISTDFMIGIQAPKTDKEVPVYMKLIELQMLFFRACFYKLFGSTNKSSRVTSDLQGSPSTCRFTPCHAAFTLQGRPF
ncbi:site-specific integrase [Brevibacillus reuszeri]|uniref:site-specific integrase n=1 Tax=Brevibacillus reuszeri TaxID=54915 RepID=UPI0006738A9A|nr:site-specific integrase [Brevibacillus reuszeri]MED1857999.1 site-specific integrase [Brevibacillus reuszeri]